MTIQVLLTVIWISSVSEPAEIVQFYTNNMDSCRVMAAQVMRGDGAWLAQCKYVKIQ